MSGRISKFFTGSGKKMTTKDYIIIALMIALGFVMPMYMPAVIIGDFTATLASHVPIMIAMFISPVAALLTAIGTALSFMLKLGIIVFMRAATHVVFALIGAFVLLRPSIRHNPIKFAALALPLGILHAACECMVVYIMLPTPPEQILYLVGLGSFTHHCIDSVIAYGVYTVLHKGKLLS